VAAVSLLVGAAGGVQAGVAGLPNGAAVASVAAVQDNVATATGNHVAASMNQIPNIESPRFESGLAPAGDASGSSIYLTGMEAGSVLQESGVNAGQADPRLTASSQDTVDPLQVATPRAVVIPFPTAAHLFVPGAVIAIFAARRMRPRYRRAVRA